MSVVDTILADVQKAEAGGASVISFVESLYSEVQKIEGSVMPLFDELKSRASEVATAVTTSPGPTGGGGQPTS